jgi:hypothetical protein
VGILWHFFEASPTSLAFAELCGAGAGATVTTTCQDSTSGTAVDPTEKMLTLGSWGNSNYSILLKSTWLHVSRSLTSGGTASSRASEGTSLCICSSSRWRLLLQMRFGGGASVGCGSARVGSEVITTSQQPVSVATHQQADFEGHNVLMF